MTGKARLMNRNFFLLWQGQLVSQIGSQAFNIAVMFWVKHVTGSASLMGLLMMVAMLPSVVLGPLGGTFADRYSRRKTIIVCDTLNGIAVLLLALLLLAGGGRTGSAVLALFLVTIFSSVVSSFFRPAISASIPDIVPEEKVQAANSLNQFSVQLSTFVGQGGGGILYRLLGAPLLFLVDGASYLFSAASEYFITIPQVYPEKTRGFGPLLKQFRTDTVQGFRYTWKKPGLLHLFLAAAVLNFFGAPYIVLLPFYVEDFLHARPDWYGFLLAGFGVGSMIGYLVAGAFRFSGRTRSFLVIAALVLASLGFASLGRLDAPALALAAFVVIGCLNGFVNVNIVSILQITTPSDVRGRVFGLLGTLSAGLMPISMGLTGVVADALDRNVALIYFSCGMISTFLCVAVSMSGEFRRFLAFETGKD